MSLKSYLHLLSIALTLALSLPAQTVRVLIVSGTANLTPAGETIPRAIVKGESVTAGTTITTGNDGRVVLTPMPGVKSIITPNTSITLESFAQSQSADTTTTYSAVLDMKVGAVVSDLNKPEGVTYDYSVRTPRGLAGARGTTFTVAVDAGGIATVVVSHGTIALTLNDGRTIAITPGHVAITKPDGSTVEAGNVNELSTADQQAVTNWMEITLEAVADAITNGAELSPETLKNVIDTTSSLGVQPTEKSTTLTKVIQAELDNINDAAPDKQDDTTKNPVPSTTPPTETTTTTNPDTNPNLPEETFATYRDNLPAEQQAAFDALSSENQQLLFEINSPWITDLILSFEQVNGVTLTENDLKINLTAMSNLSPTGMAFLEASSGPDFETGPGPSEWSVAAFEQSATTWNALSAEDQTLLINLRSTEVVMNQSLAFVTALIARAKDEIEPAYLNALIESGWGEILIDSHYDQDTRDRIIATAAGLTSAQRQLLRELDIEFDGAIESDATELGVMLDDLATLNTDQRTLAKQLDLGAGLLNYNLTELTDGLTRIDALDPAYRLAVLELELGSYFLQPQEQTLMLQDETMTTIGARLTQILDTYLSLETAHKEALRDAELFNHHNANLESSVFDPANLTQFAADFAQLPERTQILLASNRSFSIFDLINNDGEYSTELPYRSLAEFSAFAESFSDDEIEVLIDLQGAGILARALVDDVDALAKIKAAVTFYQNLPLSQKHTFHELQMLEDYAHHWLTANQTGLQRLLAAYSALPGELRAGTTFLSYPPSYTTIDSPSTFFSYSDQIYNVSFTTSAAELHIGAIKDLIIYGNNAAPTFDTAANGALFLRASDLIDLDTADFGTGIRSITMEAATINLANINFPDQSVVALNSLNGGIAFGSRGMGNGKVNFVENVRYNENLIDSQQSFNDYGQNIHLGTLANPVKAADFNALPVID